MVFTNIGSLAIISLLGIWFWIIVFWSAIWKGQKSPEKKAKIKLEIPKEDAKKITHI